ncbi:MAG: chemotaxis protein CheW [Caldilineaceae bacterium]|nr:chemotaxis protein CheW [Caldilineaceae bacterium]
MSAAPAIREPRAKAYGENQQKTTIHADEEHLVIFTLGTENYGVDISEVWEINTMLEITRIPQAPDFIEGVINLRGQIVPVMDLRKRLGLMAKEYDRDTRIMVIQTLGNRLGLIVDSVSEVVKVSQDVIEPPSQLTTLIEDNYLRGIAKQENYLIILLDVHRLLNEDEQQEIEEIQGG